MILYDLVAMQPQGNVKSHGGGTFAYMVFKRMVERQIHFCAFLIPQDTLIQRCLI